MDEAFLNAVKNTLHGSAPERSSEVAGLFDDLDLVFQLLNPNTGDDDIFMDAGQYRLVRWTTRAMPAFWIGSFAAWEAWSAVSRTTDFSEIDTSRLTILIDTFDRVVNGQDQHLSLPPFVPDPGSIPDPKTCIESHAAASLAIISVAWAILHEVRHVRHQREGTSASTDGDTIEARISEELSCDEFATRFLLQDIPRYCSATGEPEVLVRRKRETAIYFSLFTLILLSKDNWSASETHPSVEDRIINVKNCIGEERDTEALAMAHAACFALRHLWPSAPIIA